MQLIMSPASPFVRKVRVLVHEAGLADRIEEVEVTTSPMASAAEAIAANPLGRIPALLRNDGPAIYDSRVICRYLDDLAAGDFYPTAALYEVLTLEATAEGIMDSSVAMTYEKRFREDRAWPEWLDKQWEKIDRGLDSLESLWMSHLTGPINMAQIATGCALGYLDFRHGDRNWRQGRSVLVDWYETFSQRPSMTATAPD